MNFKKYTIFLLTLFTILASCKNFNFKQSSNKLLVTVYNKSLYLSDIEGMFPENATSQDSQMIITAYADRWIREQLVMSEAERNVPKDLNIDDLLKIIWFNTIHSKIKI